jgi:hypothetical protein
MGVALNNFPLLVNRQNQHLINEWDIVQITSPITIPHAEV